MTRRILLVLALGALLSGCSTARPGRSLQAPPVDRTADLVPGFRVQVFSSPSLVEAEAQRERVRALVEPPVYVEYESPFYRVRVGDFETREAAEGWRQAAAGLDFARLDVVRTLVRRGGGPGSSPPG